MSSKAQSISFLLSQVRTTSGPLAGGTVTFYVAGATTTLKAVWLDRNKATQAANPYTLDANGTAQLYGDGLYRIVIKDSAGVTRYDRDYQNIKESSVGAAYDVADYASLAAAVASIGSSTLATLEYSTDQTLTANLAVTSNIDLKPINGAKIICGAYTITGLKTATPEMFGGDTGGESTIAVTKAIASGANPIYLQAGKTYITAPFAITDRKVTFQTVSGQTGTTHDYAILQLKANSADNHITVTGVLSRLTLLHVIQDGNKSNQTLSLHGIVCTALGATSGEFADSVVMDAAIVRNNKGDGINLGMNRNNLWVRNTSFILSNDGYGVYADSSTDATILQSHIGYSGISNLHFVGTAARLSENMRVTLCDIYHGGLNNVHIGNYVRSAYLNFNDYLRADRYGIYIANSSVTNPIVDIHGGRFTYNSYETHNTYSDIYAGHDGVTVTATSHQNNSATNVVKYLIEVDGISAGAAVGAFNVNYVTAAYATAVTNDNTKIHWVGKNRNYLARDQFLRFNQSAITSTLLESYGLAGGTQFQIQANGDMRWGDGTNPIDVSIERKAAAVIGIPAGSFRIENTGTYQMRSPDGTLYHLWVDDTGKWRTKADPAPSDRNADGTIVGPP